MSEGTRLCFGDIDSFTVRRLGANSWRLGIEGRDDPSRPWTDGAWLNGLSDDGVRRIGELLTELSERQRNDP